MFPNFWKSEFQNYIKHVERILMFSIRCAFWHYHTLLSFWQLFEGMKAYRGVDDKIRMFRPFENMKRMKSTADRAYLPVSNEYLVTHIV